MAYILSTIALWVICGLTIPFDEWRKYYPVVLAAGLLGIISDLIGVVYHQWVYYGPKVGGLSLWSVLGVAPAEGVLFIRLYPAGGKWWIQGAYFLCWAVINTFFEWFFAWVGWLGYRHWNLWLAFIFYICFFGLIWAQEYWYNGTGKLRADR